MSNFWEQVCLSDICQITMGQSPNSKSYNSKRNGIPFFQGKAEFREKFAEVRTWCSEPQKIAQKGDVLISVRAPVGECNIAPEKCCIGRGLASIKSNSHKLDQDFLWYVINFQKSYFESIAQGSTFDAISNKDLINMPLKLPPLDEQKKISEVLKKIDLLLNQLQKKIDKKRFLIKATARSLLSEGINHANYKSSVIGKVPQEWDVLKLTDVIEVKHGFQFRDYHFSEKGIPIVKIGNLVHGSNVDMSSVNSFISAKKLPEFEKFQLKRHEILMALTGATLGKVSIFHSKLVALQNYRVGKFLPKGINVIKNEFIYWILQSDYIQNIIESLVNEAAQPNIGKADLEKMYIPIPPLHEQNKISSILFSIQLLSKITENKYHQIKLVKQSLIQDLFSGRIRIVV